MDNVFTTTKNELALETGVDVDSIFNVKLQLETLKRQGLLIDLNVKGTGMFTRSASFFELGIDDSTRLARYTAGSKFIIPREYVDRLRSVETRMRQLVDKYTLSISGFAPYKWLPAPAYAEFKEKWLDLLDEFVSAKADIILSLDRFSDLLAEEFAAAARQSWAALSAQGYGALISKNKQGNTVAVYVTEESYVDAVVAAAQSYMPTAQDVEKNLTADYRVGIITTDLDVAEMESAKKVIRAQEYAERQAAYFKAAEAEKEFQHKQHLLDVANEIADIEAREAELRKIKLQIEVEAMMQAEVAHAKEQLAQMRSPFEEVLGALRAQMARDAEDMLESIEKNGFVRGKVAERGAGLLSFFELMGASDEELYTKLQALKSQLGPIGQDRNNDAPVRDTQQIAETLKSIVALAHVEAKELQTISKAAFIEL